MTPTQPLRLTTDPAALGLVRDFLMQTAQLSAAQADAEMQRRGVIEIYERQRCALDQCDNAASAYFVEDAHRSSPPAQRTICLKVYGICTEHQGLHAVSPAAVKSEFDHLFWYLPENRPNWDIGNEMWRELQHTAVSLLEKSGLKRRAGWAELRRRGLQAVGKHRTCIQCGENAIGCVVFDLEEHLPPEQRQGQFRVAALCESDMDIEIGGDEYHALLETLRQSTRT